MSWLEISQNKYICNKLQTSMDIDKAYLQQSLNKQKLGTNYLEEIVQLNS